MTGSMSAKLEGKSDAVKSLLPPWLLRFAQRMGWKPSYAKAKLFDRDRDVLRPVLIAVEEMLQADREHLVDRWLLELDLLRAGINPSTGEHRTVVVEDAQIDAAEDVARVEYLSDPNPRTFGSVVRHAWDVIRSKLKVIKSGKQQYPELV